MVINGSNVMNACLSACRIDGCLRAADLGSSWWPRCSKKLIAISKTETEFRKSAQWKQAMGRSWWTPYDSGWTPSTSVQARLYPWKRDFNIKRENIEIKLN